MMYRLEDEEVWEAFEAATTIASFKAWTIGFYLCVSSGCFDVFESISYEIRELWSMRNNGRSFPFMLIYMITKKTTQTKTVQILSNTRRKIQCISLYIENRERDDY